MAVNTVTSVDVKTLTPFKRFIMTLGELPTSYLESMTYAELVMWFCNFLQEKVIPTVNNNADALNDVIHYLETLDLQDEVDHKLDEMVESGQLQEIIADYLNSKAIFGFDNVQSMKEATNLIDGSFAKTLGFYEKNDGGMSTYKIRKITNDDVINEISIIALNDNTLIAELIINDIMNLTQLGVHQDDSTDDSDLLQKAINFADTNNIELKGSYKPIIISKSIYIPVYIKISNCYFKTSSPASNFTNGYMIGINTTNMSSWTLAYPYSNRGFMKNCRFDNTNQNELINGIYNCANNRFEDIYFYQLNNSFKSASTYLDTVIMKNFNIGYKIGTEYALNLGYLGDQCSLDTAHMSGTIGTRNFCYIGNAHNPIALSNIIANGKIYSENSIINIKNIHNEDQTQNQFEFKNCQVKIENGYLYHVNQASDYNIILKDNTSLQLENTIFCYYMDLNTYQNTTDIDVDILTNSSFTSINNYKVVTSLTAGNQKIRSNIKTNLDKQPSTKNILVYNNATCYQEDNQGNYENVTIDVGYPSTSTLTKWALPSGTYYYRFVTLLDKQRMIASFWNKKLNQAMTNNGGGFLVGSANSNVYRIYRGTADESYTDYVDVANINTTLFDNGYMLNGYKWQSREASNIDTFLTGVLTLNRPNKDNVIITGDYSATPTVGTWKRGDIIFSTHAGITGYICIADGTPGTWKQL